MKIQMKLQITGTRDGVAWPAPGGEVDLPDNEAKKMLEAGFATPVVEKRQEKAVAPEPEKRARKATAKD